MNRFKRVLCALTAGCLLFSLGGCQSTESASLREILDGISDFFTVPPEKDKDDTAVDVTVPADEPILEDGKNIITGKMDTDGCELLRPVGIMIANNDFIQDDQVGLSSADMWMEAETEAGITRIMAVFASTERVPEEIGPVRSARSPFFHVVEALGLAYVHAGGSYTALDKIAHSDVADMDVDENEYGWRDEDFPYDYEYCLRTDGETLTRYMQDMEYQTTPIRKFPWTFGEQTGEPAQTVRLDMSSAQCIGFDYDRDEGVYYKLNGASESRHCDSSVTPITAKNVLVLFSDKIWENDVTIDFTLESGKGYVFSDGVTRRFDWSRGDDGFTMNEEDGSQLRLAEGKVYLCVVSSEHENSLQYAAE